MDRRSTIPIEYYVDRGCLNKDGSDTHKQEVTRRIRQKTIKRIYKNDLIPPRSEKDKQKIDPIERYQKTGLIFWNNNDEKPC